MKRSRNEPSPATWADFESDVSALASWADVRRYALAGPQSVLAGGDFHTNLCLLLRFGAAPDDLEAREQALHRALLSRLGAVPRRTGRP